MSATDMPFERLEALLRGDEPRTLGEKQTASVLAELRAGELGAPESLRQRVLDVGAARAGGRRLSMPRRKLFVLVPVAAALAVGAALIHGAFTSGRTPLSAASIPPANRGFAQGNPRLGVVNTPQTGKKLALTARETPTATGGSGSITQGDNRYFAPAHSHAALAYSAIQSRPGSVLTADAAGTTSADALTGSVSGNAPVTIPKGRLVHADASLQVVVASHDALTSATNKATQIVTKLGGYAASVQYQASHKGDGNAYLDLRVPIGKVETASGQLAALGKLYSQQIATQDLQTQFTKQTNTIGRLQRAIAIYQQALASGTVSGSQRVEVQIRLANAEHQLTSQRKARSQTVAAAATATIQLELTTDQHAFAISHKTGRLGRLLGNAGDFLGLEGIIVLYVLIVAGPIAILVWLGWAVLRERRRRDERRLLAST